MIAPQATPEDIRNIQIDHSVNLSKDSSFVKNNNNPKIEVVLSGFDIEEKSTPSSQKFFRIPQYQKPTNYPDNFTPINIAIRITNTTSKPLYFARFGSIHLSVIDSNGREVEQSANWRTVDPPYVGSILARPGETINLSFHGTIKWINQEVSIQFSGSYPTSPIFFNGLKTGIYKLQLTYSNNFDETSLFERNTLLFLDPSYKSINEVWKGELTAPVVDFYLVQ